MIDNVLTGRKIAELRLSRGLTQQQLAAMMGVSHQAVSKWESGQTLPDIQTMLALTQFFGITIEQLITEKGEIEDAKNETAEDAQPGETEAETTMEVKEMNLQQLLQMAPFMSKEAVEEIAMAIAEPMSARQISKLAPYMNPECVEALIEKYHPALDWDSLRKLAPFMRRESVDALARRIASGETIVQEAVAPFNKAMNDIGKCIEDIGKGIEKGFDDFGKGLEKGFDDFGKGVDKAVRKAVRFGENVINEVNKAINAEEIQRQEEKARTERTRAIRKKAFERAILDERWDWLGLHIDEMNGDDELMGRIVVAAREKGMQDWIREHVNGYADMASVDAALAAGDWEWLGENIWELGSDVHEKVALAAAEAGKWEWMRSYSDPLELVNCTEEIASAALEAGEHTFCAQFAAAHMTEAQVDALSEEALELECFDALGLLLKQCSAARREEVLLRLAGEENWERLLDYAQYANADLLEKLMEMAVEAGNFDAIDMLDALM